MRAVVIDGPDPDDWREREIGDDLDALQKLVGGWIERLGCIDPDRAMVFINEEGRNDELPVHALWVEPVQDQPRIAVVRDALHGPIVILGPVRNGNSTDVTPEALAYVKTLVRPVHQLPSGLRLFLGPRPCARCGGVGMEPEAGADLDWRALLRKYIERVSIQNGADFLTGFNKEDGPGFTEAEYAALLALTGTPCA